MTKHIITLSLLLIMSKACAVELYDGKYSIESIMTYDKQEKKIGKITPKEKTKEFMFIEIGKETIVISMAKDIVINSSYKLIKNNEDGSTDVSVVSDSVEFPNNWLLKDGKLIIVQTESTSGNKNVFTANKINP